MGGRIALGLFESSPDLFKTVLLISPDGLHTHFVYRFCTANNSWLCVFKWMMNLRPLNGLANGIKTGIDWR